MHSRVARSSLAFVALVASAATACTHVPGPPVPTRRPRAVVTTGGRTDREGRYPWSPHPQALAWLTEASFETRWTSWFDLPLPDGGMWGNVSFMGVHTLVGFRYLNSDSKYHAAVSAIAFPASPVTVEDCAARFARKARSLAKTWDFVLGEPRIDHVAQQWSEDRNDVRAHVPPRSADIYSLDVIGRSLFGNSEWAAAFGVYAGWPEACLVVALFVPHRGEPELAREVRDRLVRQSLSRLALVPAAGVRALADAADID